MGNFRKTSSVALLSFSVAVLVLGCACNASRVKELEEEVKLQRDKEAIHMGIIDADKKRIEAQRQTIDELNKKVSELDEELKAETNAHNSLKETHQKTLAALNECRNSD